MNNILFALAHIFSAFGYEFLTFVMTIHVYELTKQAVDVGIFMAVSFVPRLFSSFYGLLTDRYSRRWLFSGACLMTAIATVILEGQSTLTGFYAGWFVISVLAMVILNLRSAIMTQLMPEGNFLRVNALMLISLNVARLAAPVIGGIAATWWSAGAVLSVAAGVYAVAALAGIVLHLPGTDNSKTALSSVFVRLREGFRLIWRDADLAALGAISFLWRLSLGFQSALLVVYVTQSLGKGRLEFGVLTSAFALGSIFGGIIGPSLTKWLTTRIVLKTGVCLHFLLIGGLGLITNYSLAFVVAVLANSVLYAATVAVHSVRDTATPAEYRGRVYGCITAITAPPALISVLLGGWLADIVGVRCVFIGGGALATIGLLMVFVLSRADFTVGRSAPSPCRLSR